MNNTRWNEQEYLPLCAPDIGQEDQKAPQDAQVAKQLKRDLSVTSRVGLLFCTAKRTLFVVIFHHDQVTPKEIHMRKRDRYAMFRCNKDGRYPELFVLKDHTSFLGGKPEIRFWTCKDPKKFKDWTRRLNRKNIEVNKNTKICSNHFEFGRPVD